MRFELGTLGRYTVNSSSCAKNRQLSALGIQTKLALDDLTPITTSSRLSPLRNFIPHLNISLFPVFRVFL